ncbi:Hypothetical predicted protein [Paramuricea clavata]|uniref:Uncharacterized protein n=1 Tax=Paramuricea clavata TaxID=317549 RepID=A0A7D9EU74_PARCT|nr:Hypothetical predicted protein [Paramuricea clavata]
MKNFGVLVLLLLAFLSSITCAPISNTSTSHVQWYKRAPSFMINLFNQIVATQGDLSQLGGTHVRGIWTIVKKPQNTVSSANVVNLLSVVNGTSLSLNTTYLVNLHVSVEAKTGVQQGDCNVALYDVKSNTEILSKYIPCDTSSKLVLAVTSCVKKWITNPAENAGMRLKISAKTDKFPASSLPFVNTHPSVEPPFYILYL